MNAILYVPQQAPHLVPVEGLSLPDPVTGFASVNEQVASLLNCTANLVDVLASSPQYVAYSVFDFEGPINHSAMVAVAEIAGVIFDPDDEDAILCGPVLIVTG